MTGDTLENPVSPHGEGRPREVTGDTLENPVSTHGEVNPGTALGLDSEVPGRDVLHGNNEP